MATDKKPITKKPGRVKRVSIQSAQFKAELSVLNQAMRVALEEYIAHNKNKNIKITYIELSRVIGVSDTHMYSLKHGRSDVSTQVIARMLLRTPAIKPFFTKAYDSIVKRGGYSGGLLDGILGNEENRSVENSIDELDALKKELSDANDRIKELSAIMRTKDEFIEKLLAKVGDPT